MLLHVSACCQSHINWWTRLSVTEPISPAVYVELEGQMRRQNNLFNQAAWNPAYEHLTHSIRVFVHYKPSPKFAASISPFTWFAASPIIVSPSDADAPLQHEFRYAALTEWQPELSKKWTATLRAWAEYRHFQNESVDDAVRLRQRLGVRYRFNDKWIAFAANELLLHVFGMAEKQHYDHNRLIFNVHYKPNARWRVELGYIYINRLLRNRMELIDENNLVTHFYYTLPPKK
ncbi:MAG: DUF2490 domain-containing protein [Cytophagales bacterium]|nr:DUF2490 domain-containing protein [Bernardetiaceae bacterium]MDW8204266.1 DUF2490 domain-containing protein [Cytophagales bacterium]